MTLSGYKFDTLIKHAHFFNSKNQFRFKRLTVVNALPLAGFTLVESVSQTDVCMVLAKIA